MGEGAAFDPACRRCRRLAAFIDQVRKQHPDYHCGPVAPFGSARHRLLVVGLAPGMHGANRTGRPFTGDAAGVLLYETLFAHGFATRAKSVALDDGLKLRDCRITNAVKCLPPDNTPTTDEAKECSRYLRPEIDALPASAVILALGGTAHDAVLRALGIRLSSARFSHGAQHDLPGRRILLDSYHCSGRNTKTGKLTTAMFDAVFARARRLLAA